MPRIVDRDQRRQEIAEAAWRVINSSGIEAASLHAVARTLGSTTGAIAHYFSNKEELISFTFETKTNAVFASIESEARRKPPGLPRLRAALARMAPVLASTSNHGGAATLSYWGLAVSNPLYARLHKHSYRRWRGIVHGYMLEAIALSHLPADCDAEIEASLLMTLVDGLLVGATLEPTRVTAKSGARMLDAAIARIGAGDCGQPRLSPRPKQPGADRSARKAAP